MFLDIDWFCIKPRLEYMTLLETIFLSIRRLFRRFRISFEKETIKSLDEISEEIRQHLTGDTESDIRYLCDLDDRYRTSYEDEETRQFIFKEMIASFSENERQQLDVILGQTGSGFSKYIDIAIDRLSEGKYHQAAGLFEKIIEEVEMLEEVDFGTDVLRYSFYENIDMLIFRGIRNIDAMIVSTEEDYGFLYRQYGLSLLGLERMDAARNAFRKSLRYNPMNFDTRFDYIEIFAVKGQLEEFLSLTIETLKYAYTRDVIARVYHNIGNYFRRKKEYVMAVHCLTFSLMIWADELVREMLDEVMKCQHELTELPDVQAVKLELTKHGLPLAPDDRVVEVLEEIYSDLIEADYETSRIARNHLSELKKLRFASE